MKRGWGIQLSARGPRLRLTPRRWVSLPHEPTAKHRRAVRVAQDRPAKTTAQIVEKPARPRSVPLFGLPVIRGFVEPTWVDLSEDQPQDERYVIDVSKRGLGGLGEERAPTQESRPHPSLPKQARNPKI